MSENVIWSLISNLLALDAERLNLSTLASSSFYIKRVSI